MSTNNKNSISAKIQSDFLTCLKSFQKVWLQWRHLYAKNQSSSAFFSLLLSFCIRLRFFSFTTPKKVCDSDSKSKMIFLLWFGLVSSDPSCYPRLLLAIHNFGFDEATFTLNVLINLMFDWKMWRQKMSND